MENTFEIKPFESFEEVRSFEVNPEKYFNIAGIVRKFQEIAWEHAAQLNYGFYDLAERNLHWVLARTEIHIHQKIEWTDTIKLRTWPSALDSLFFLRDFEYLNAKNQVCVSGSASWLILNENLRPQIPHHILDKIPIFCEKALPENPRKLRLKQNMEFVFSINVRFSDLDPNHHTNNVRYYQWVCDCLHEKGILENSIKRVEMNFLYESRFNDVLQIYYAFNGDAHWVKAIRNEERDVFLCRVEAVVS